MLSYALEVLTNDSNPSYQVYCRISNISQSAWSLSFLFAFLFLFLFLAFVMTWNTQKSGMDQAKALQTDWSWQLPSKALKMRPKYWWLTQIDIEAESSLLLTCLAWILKKCARTMSPLQFGLTVWGHISWHKADMYWHRLTWADIG